jgi:hypothetical protein
MRKGQQQKKNKEEEQEREHRRQQQARTRGEKNAWKRKAQRVHFVPY